MDIQFPQYIQTLKPYVPGKPIDETKREYGLKQVIKLASNENPLGPSPKAILAMKKGFGDLHRYPDSSGFELKTDLGLHLNISPKNICLGNGSNELIDLMICALCVPGDAIVTSEAAFVAYKVCAQVHGVRTLEASLDEDLKFDLDNMLDLIKSDSKVKIVFIPNPNNPTGTYVNKNNLYSFLSEVSKIRGGSVWVVLDYAYWEYVTASDLPEPLEMFERFSRVVVLRTFSKIYGLAGIRVGYGIAQEELVQTLDKIREPFNINTLGLIGARAALKDRQFVKKSRELNLLGMKFWEKELTQLSVPYWKSQGNFLLIDTLGGFGKPGGEVFVSCLRKGVIFRPVLNYGLPQALRITVGTEKENLKAMQVLRLMK